MAFPNNPKHSVDPNGKIECDQLNLKRLILRRNFKQGVSGTNLFLRAVIDGVRRIGNITNLC